MTEGRVLVSQRAAARVLSGGLGLSRRHGERVLAAGLAGPPLVAGGARLFDLGRVEQLLSWPAVDAGYVDEACPGGYFVARRSGGHELRDLREGWDIAWIGTIWMQIHVERHGPMPLVSTVSGFVVRGADIASVDFGADGRAAFELSEPGPWFEGLEGRRFVTGPGRDYVVRLPGWTPRPLRYASGATYGTMGP